MLTADDWIYVTKDTGGNCWDLVPETFNTRKKAEEFAKIWRKKRGTQSFVEVVEYDG